MRLAKTLTIEQSILEEVERSKRGRSTSERVNELLKCALEHERAQELALEAQLFFEEASLKKRHEERAFQKAALRTLTRE